MKSLTRIVLCAALLATALVARAERIFNQAELDALLAPVALYPDNVLSNILVAASYPDDVHEAAAWSRGKPQLRGDEALRLAQSTPWHPSVQALAAFPEILARMDESPAWLNDLGAAYRVHGPYVMDTVQTLRQRARASGYLQSDGYQQVYDDGGAIAIAPVYPSYVYVRYYDPFIVYGPWWWPAYRPVVWRPWPVYRTYVSVGFVPARADWHRRTVVVNRPVVVNRTVVVNRPVHVDRPVARTQFNGTPSPAVREQQKAWRERQIQQQRQQPQPQYNRVPESQRQPIVQQHYQQQRSQIQQQRSQTASINHNRGHQQHRGGDRRN